MAKKVKAPVARRQYLAAITAAAKCIPTTWMHDYLSGPNKVGDLPYNGPQIEELLGRIRADILALAQKE
jgi:hypothetical protein